MTYSSRQANLKLEDLITKPYKIAEALKNKEWDTLLQVSEFLDTCPPKDLPQTDPARFRKLMCGITECYILGWHKLNKSNLKKLSRKNK
jgi:hypothetical protein